MSTPGPIETLARLVGEALSPLAERLQGNGAEQTLEELGLRLPSGSLAAANVTQGLQVSAGLCAQLPQAVAQLVAAINGGNDGALLNAAVTLGGRIVQAGAAFTQLGLALDNAVQGAAGLTAAQKTRLRAAAQSVPERLLHLALISYLEDELPAVKGGLDLAGLFDDIAIPGDRNDASIPPHHFKQIRFDRLTALVSNPVQHLKDLYGFGRPNFDGLELFRRIKALVDRPEAKAILITAPGQPAALEAFIFRLAVAPGPIPALRIRVRVAAEKDIDVAIPLGGPWAATVSSKARFLSGLEFLWHPQTGLHIEPPATQATVDFGFGVKAEKAGGQPMILLGQAGGSRLELLRFSSRVLLKLSASTGAPSPDVKPGAEVEIKQGKLVIDTSRADGFIATLLGGLKIESGFDLGASYDTEKGLRFHGSATIEIAIPVHLTLGPVSIPTIYLIGGFRDGQVPIEFSVDMSAQLGPLTMAVGRMGAIANVSFPPRGGNAGVAQIDVAFKPPNGVGLAVDAGIIKGGGYLYIDVERGEYAGALELTLSGIVSLKAIGIITTRMPDGSSGFSLLIIITAEFGVGIQLGFGFTLLAVGGLLGLNRTVRLEPLTQGVRTGAVNSIMFPRDVVANAPKIISDLRTIFPPEQGKFLIGPMAKLGWGTPTLVSLSLGIIIEIPGNIAIVGVLKVALPTEEAAIIILQVAFVGAIEFDKKRLYFFASMFESRVVFCPMEGEMGVLAAFGDDANFVLSVGGFHPRFNPPPLPFPAPRRISIDLVNNPLQRVRIEGYFAVTSNSAQFGARAELFYGIDDFNVRGHIAFDALLQFSPFFFIVEISASFSVTVFGAGLFSVRISLSLEGPTPYRARGTGEISILFFDFSVDFSVTWGESRDTALPPIAVMPIFKAELEKPENWRALLPPGNNLLVALRKLPEAETALVLHPVGVLRVSQRALPLGLKLDRVGHQKPSDVNRLTVQVADGGLGKKGDAFEQFAPAQFQDMDDAAKLSQQAYGPQQAGVELSIAGPQVASSRMVRRVVRYEEITFDTAYRRHQRRFFAFTGALFDLFLKGAAISRSVLSQATKEKLQPFTDKIVVQPEQWTVAHQSTNQAFAAAATSFASEASAREFLRQQVAADPNLGESLHVIPGYERAA